MTLVECIPQDQREWQVAVGLLQPRERMTT
jgi:hypothetical protein